jgi:hypothetical protein
MTDNKILSADQVVGWLRAAQVLVESHGALRAALVEAEATNVEVRERNAALACFLHDEKAEVVRLRAALKTYGKHTKDCPMSGRGAVEDVDPCSCGLAQLLDPEGH